MCQGIRDVRDQRGCFGVHLAALEAEATVDAMWTVAEPAVGDGHRPYPGRDAQGVAPGLEDHAVTRDGVRGVRVPVRVAPRPRLSRDRELLLDRFVVGAQILVGDGPVGAHPVGGADGEVRRVEPGRVAGEVHHGPPDTASGVVRPEWYRVGAGDDPWLGPVQVM